MTLPFRQIIDSNWTVLPPEYFAYLAKLEDLHVWTPDDHVSKRTFHLVQNDGTYFTLVRLPDNTVTQAWRVEYA